MVELKVDIGLTQLMELIRQLPLRDKKRIRAMLDASPNAKDASKDDIEEFLLSAPTFSDEQLELIREAREGINKWRKK
jgi:hypothetical protein